MLVIFSCYFKIIFILYTLREKEIVMAIIKVTYRVLYVEKKYTHSYINIKYLFNYTYTLILHIVMSKSQDSFISWDLLG